MPPEGQERQQKIQEISQGLDRVQEGLAGIAERRAAATSEEARSETRSIRDEIDNAVSRDQNRLGEIARQEQQLIGEQQENLRQRFEQQRKRIQTEFQQERQLTEQEQEKQFSARNVGLIEQAGGYLGLSQSHEGVLQNLRETHRRELRTLQAQKQSALQQAENAFNDRNFELARAKLQIARNAESEEFERENALIQREISLATNQRQEESFELEKEDRLVENIAPGIAQELKNIDSSEERDRIITNRAEQNGISVESLTSAVGAQIREQRLDDLKIKQAQSDIRSARAELTGSGSATTQGLISLYGDEIMTSISEGTSPSEIVASVALQEDQLGNELRLDERRDLYNTVVEAQEKVNQGVGQRQAEESESVLPGETPAQARGRELRESLGGIDDFLIEDVGGASESVFDFGTGLLGGERESRLDVQLGKFLADF